MESIAGWIAPIATMAAAMMTAANLGARVTGWGFVVFALGSVCWVVVGINTGQTNLLATNGFLLFVNMVGIWRWLGKQRAYEDGGRSATIASRRSSVPTLFTATGIAGMMTQDAQGESLGKAVEALIECVSGRISYVVIASEHHGLREDLRAIPLDRITLGPDRIRVGMDKCEFHAWPVLASDAWPAAAAHREPPAISTGTGCRTGA
ncbi:hypothetical protein SPH9361_03632 [Sphingobium sp. CECT 9361]|nr:hypothetical protein SPH9361_03632 [Sphingobium sp. CECT 9361]